MANRFDRAISRMDRVISKRMGQSAALPDGRWMTYFPVVGMVAPDSPSSFGVAAQRDAIEFFESDWPEHSPGQKLQSSGRTIKLSGVRHRDAGMVSYWITYEQ